jgi:alpha-L-rhamnosidase
VWLDGEDEFAGADGRAQLAWMGGSEPLDPRVQGFRIDFNAPSDLVDA